MKKESLISFMREIAGELKKSGNLGTAHVYRSSLNAILTFHGSEKLMFHQLTPEWLKHFEGSLRHRGCSWNTVSTYIRTLRAVYNQSGNRTKSSGICTSIVSFSLYGYTRRPSACVRYRRYKEDVYPVAAGNWFTGHFRHARCTRMVYPNVSASWIAVCRFCLSTQKRFTGKCHYVSPTQNGTFIVGDTDTGSNDSVAEAYEP